MYDGVLHIIQAPTGKSLRSYCEGGWMNNV